MWLKTGVMAAKNSALQSHKIINILNILKQKTIILNFNISHYACFTVFMIKNAALVSMSFSKTLKINLMTPNFIIVVYISKISIIVNNAVDIP